MPFTVINDINADREIENPEKFDPWVTMVYYSLFPDTIYYAQMMNINNNLEPDVQLSYYINTVRPSKRWRKWPKKSVCEDIKLLQEVFGYSENKAKTALAVLSEAQMKELKKKYKKE